MMSQNLDMTAVAAMTGSPVRSAPQCSPADGVNVAGVDELPELPPGIAPYRAAFKNWSGEIVVESLWTCSASTPEDVVLQYQNQ